MPIKKIPNSVSVRTIDSEEVVSFFTSNKRNHFQSDSKLFEEIECNVKRVNQIFTAHLTTYPLIAVHVTCGDKKLLANSRDALHKAVDDALQNQLKQT